MIPLRNKSRRMRAKGAYERALFSGWRKVETMTIKARRWAKTAFNRRFRRQEPFDEIVEEYLREMSDPELHEKFKRATITDYRRPGWQRDEPLGVDEE